MTDKPTRHQRARAEMAALQALANAAYDPELDRAVADGVMAIAQKLAAQWGASIPPAMSVKKKED